MSGLLTFCCRRFCDGNVEERLVGYMNMVWNIRVQGRLRLVRVLFSLGEQEGEKSLSVLGLVFMYAICFNLVLNGCEMPMELLRDKHRVHCCYERRRGSRLTTSFYSSY